VGTRGWRALTAPDQATLPRDTAKSAVRKRRRTNRQSGCVVVQANVHGYSRTWQSRGSAHRKRRRQTSYGIPVHGVGLVSTVQAFRPVICHNTCFFPAEAGHGHLAEGKYVHVNKENGVDTPDINWWWAPQEAHRTARRCCPAQAVYR